MSKPDPAPPVVSNSGHKAILIVGLLLLTAFLIQAGLLAKIWVEITSIQITGKSKYQLVWDIPNRLVGLGVSLFTACFVLLYDRVDASFKPKAVLLFALVACGFAFLVFLSEKNLQTKTHALLAGQGLVLCETTHIGKGKYRRAVFNYSNRCQGL